MAESTVKAAVSTVRSFYNNHGITTPRTRLKYKKGEDATSALTVSDLPGIDEIRRAFAVANTKFKSIILTMASSGMDASTLTTLKVEGFIEGLGGNAETLQSGGLDIDGTRDKLDKSNNPVVTWKAMRPKMIRDGQGTYYTTFSTPEAIHSIFDYLEASPPRDQTVPLFRRYTRFPDY